MAKKKRKTAPPPKSLRFEDEVIGWLILLIVLLVPTLVYPPMLDMYDLAKATTVRILVISLLFFWWLRVSFGERATLRRGVGDAPLAAFLTILGATVVTSVVPIISLVGAFKRHEGWTTFLAYGVIYFTTVNFVRRYSDLKRILFVTFVASNLAAIYAVLQRTGIPYSSSWGRGWDWLAFSADKYELVRAFSSLGNPVFLASYMAMILPLALAAYFSARGLADQAFAAVTGLLALAALIFTYSRGGWWGALAGVIVLLVMAAPAIARRWKALAVAVALIVLLGWLIDLAPIQRQGVGSSVIERAVSSVKLGEGSTATRAEMWKSTFNVIKARPLTGFGLEVFKEVYPRYRTERLVRLEGEMSLPDRPHNEALYLAATGGIFALLAYLWFLFAVWGRAFQWLRRSESQEQKLVVGGLIAATVAVEAAAQASFSMITVTPVFFVMMGLLAVTAPPRGGRQEVSFRLPGLDSEGARYAALAGVTVLLLALGVFSWRLGVADVYYNAGVNAESMGQLPTALVGYSEAVSLNPWQNMYRLNLGASLQRQAQASRDRGIADQALQVYRDGVAMDPLDEDTWANMGDAYRNYAAQWNDPAKLDNAIAAYRQAIRIDPWFAAPNEGAGAIWIQRNRPAEAIPYLRAAVRVDPKRTESFYLLGLSYEVGNRVEEARAAFRKVLELDPKHSGARKELAKLTRSK